MKDCHTSLEILSRDAAEAALVLDLAGAKYDRLHQHFTRRAGEVEQAMRDSRKQALEPNLLPNSRITHFKPNQRPRKPTRLETVLVRNTAAVIEFLWRGLLDIPATLGGSRRVSQPVWGLSLYRRDTPRRAHRNETSHRPFPFFKTGRETFQ